MISIFNGRSRGLGEQDRKAVHLQISVQLREHLHLFKGAKLSVLLAIALHINEEGWSFPSIPTLRKETGYDSTTISKALTELCKIEIDGHRVLLSVQKNEAGKFSNNHYLIFPSEADVAAYEDGNTEARHARIKSEAEQSIDDPTPVGDPSMDFPYTQKPYTEKPYTEKPSTENPMLRRTIGKEEPGISGGDTRAREQRPTEPPASTPPPGLAASDQALRSRGFDAKQRAKINTARGPLTTQEIADLPGHLESLKRAGKHNPMGIVYNSLVDGQSIPHPESEPEIRPPRPTLTFDDDGIPNDANLLRQILAEKRATEQAAPRFPR